MPRGVFDEALQDCLRILPKVQADKRAILGLAAESAERAGKLTEVSPELCKFLAGVQEDEATLLVEGILLEGEGRQQDAVTHYTEAIRRLPYGTRLLGRLYVLFQLRGQARALLPLVEKVLSVQPDSPQVLAIHGACLVAAERFDDALASLNKALKQDPDHVTALINLGVCYSKLERDADAVKVLASAVKKGPAITEGWIELGVSHAKLEHFNDAEKAFRKALELEPKSGPAAMGLAVTLTQTGRAGEARKVLQNALNLNPNQPRVRAMLDDLSH